MFYRNGFFNNLLPGFIYFIATFFVGCAALNILPSYTYHLFSVLIAFTILSPVSYLFNTYLNFVVEPHNSEDN